MKILTISMMLMTFSPLCAQDVIFKKNGDEIKAKVQKITETEIEYSKWSNLNGPKYIISKANVFMVKYENGEKDVFNNIEESSSSSSKEKTQAKGTHGSQIFIEKEPAPNNQKLIACHNAPISFTKNAKDKNAKSGFPIMGITETSLLSTDELEMQFVPAVVGGGGFLKYYVLLKNKTNNIIYVDKANSFKILGDNTYTAYYDTKQINVSQGSSSGAGLGLGAVTNILGIGGVVGTLANATTVGGSSQGTVSTTYSQQRIIAIPPHATAHLTEYENVNVKGDKYKLVSDIEYWQIPDDKYRRGIVKKDGYTSFTEETSIYNTKYIITYSTSQDFSRYSMLNAQLYVRYLVGDFYLFIGQEKEALKELRKSISNFSLDSNIMVGRNTFFSK